jgi:predicted ATPase/class 3 adenylate cyclase
MGLPEGVVTLVFTDIEGSTELLHRLGANYGAVLEAHRRLLRYAWRAYDGAEVDTEGDGFFVAFASANRAVEAVAAAQVAIAEYRWPSGGEVRVRIGVHTGEPQLRDDGYWGIDVHYAARLCSAAHGGQVLLSAATRGLLGDVEADDLGELALKDFATPRRVFHLVLGGRHADAFLPPRTLKAARMNLPSLSTRLVGRETELAELEHRLTATSERLVTITGPGGSGKTKLAIACGTELRDRFADGVFLVALAPIPDAEGILPALIDALGVPPHSLGEERGAIEFLSDRELVLILDNFEHILDAAPLVGRLVEAAPGLRVLVTSQAPLGLVAETVIRLTPLELPDRDEVDPARLGRVSSVRLFVERARALDPSFTLDSQNAAAVAGLCLTLDGLPLALELAAARVRLVGAQALLDALDQGIDALGKGHRDLPARQRGLRAALDFSVSLLDTDARALFVALGAFADAWTIEQAGRLVGDETDAWEAMLLLLELSLVRIRGDGRLTMAERVKSHARELLQASGREGELRDRHAELMAEMIEAFDLELYLDRDAMLANVRSVVEEVEYAIAWARQHDSASHRRLVGASGSIFAFIQRQSPLADDIRRLSDQETCVDETSGCIFAARGSVEWSFGDRSQAPVWTARAVECHRQTASQQRLLATMAAHNQDVILSNDGPGTRAAVREALAAAVGFPDPGYVEMFEVQLAAAAVIEERYEEAEATFQAVLARPARTSVASLAALAYGGLCALGRRDGEIALARTKAYLEDRVRADDVTNGVLALMEIVATLVLLERDNEAAQLFGGIERTTRELLGWPDPYVSPALVTSPLEALAERLGPEGFAREKERGGGLAYEELVSLARSMATPAGQHP